MGLAAMGIFAVGDTPGISMAGPCADQVTARGKEERAPGRSRLRQDSKQGD